MINLLIWGSGDLSLDLVVYLAFLGAAATPEHGAEEN
jgi:hypothetical protein